MSYLGDLSLRLAVGAGNLPERFRARHAAFLAAAQRDDGGFGGRKGGSDLYYTSFALRGLAILGELGDDAARRTAAFLQERLAQKTQLSAIDFLSLVIGATLIEMSAGIDVFAAAGCDRRQTVLDFIAGLRRDDGGYAKSQRSPHSSTYQTFLCEACRQLVDAPPEDAARTVALIRSRQRDDGGFVEIDVMPHSGTNPTAAAIGALRLLDALDEPTRASAAAFLAHMQTPEGGLRANSRIPVADLLSTFTGLVAMETGEKETDSVSPVSLDLPAAKRFVASLEQPAGGFRAGFWDDTADVEYTFYGIGTLALLSG